jgi:peptidoglycan/LPS O-acetylase OafA/YrhL
MMKFENMIIGAFGAIILKNNISKSLYLVYNPFVFISSIVGVFLSIYVTPNFLKDGLHIIHSIFFIIIILNISTNKKYFSILESKFLNLLGTISYGIYMYHMVVIYFVIKSFTYYDFFDINSFYGFLYLYGLTISITILISYFSYYYFEIKFLNLKIILINSFKP